MSDAITPAMITGSTLNDINAALAVMERSANELSSGKTILPAFAETRRRGTRDRPAEPARRAVAPTRASIQDGIVLGKNTSTGAMSDMATTVQRVRELLVRSGNGTFNRDDLNTMALEIEQLTESVKQDANTQVRRPVRVRGHRDHDVALTHKGPEPTNTTATRHDRAR